MPSVLSRRSKALTLAPLALLSGVWTASLFSSSATADDAGEASSLPDGTAVPAEAIEAPASVPVPGVVAPAVPAGAADSVVASASTNGIPAPALSAYQRAAQIIDSADQACKIPWELIAAVGRVESDHGRYGGNTLSDKGLSTPGIYGIPLNGSNGTAAINDTDAGLLDKDEVWDRAVGPMQFIPSTWQVVKVDANGDGERNPQDINDAALAAAVYLCSGNEDLSTRAGQEAALFRYNRSDEYKNLVLRIMEAYATGDFTAVPSGTQGGTTFSPSFSSTIAEGYQAKKQREVRQREQRGQAGTGGSTGGSSNGTGSAGGTDGTGSVGGGTVTNPATPDIGGNGGNGGGVDTGTGGKVVDDTVGKVTEGVKGVVDGVTGGVDTATGGATAPVTGTVREIVTATEARVICLAKGISALDLGGALTTCIAATKTG